MPFLDTVQKYPSRLYTYVSDSEVVNTAEKKQYYVKTYAQWSIADPALFSLKLGSMTSAENQLDNLISPGHRAGHQPPDGRRLRPQQGKDALNAALAQEKEKQKRNGGIIKEIRGKGKAWQTIPQIH